MHVGEYVPEKTFRLHNGRMYPAVGLSTYRIRMPEVVYRVIDEALRVGYRFFDTCPSCYNELALGNALRALLPRHNLTRRDIYISSKLVAVDEGSERGVISECRRSMEKLGVDYIDLYLISSSLNVSMELTTAWSALLNLRQEGYVVSIGVTNFTIPQIEEITRTTNVIPMVNQVEFHPNHCNEKLYSFCMSHSILIQGYSPFGSPFARYKTLFKDKVIRSISGSYSATEVQVLLMWGLQHGIMMLPAMSKPQHLHDSIDFHLMLSNYDLGRISALSLPFEDADIAT